MRKTRAATRKRQPFTRHIGVVLDRDAFERELAARGLEAQDLAKLTGLEASAISRARKGGRIRRDTLMRIVDALEKVPVRKMAAALTKVGTASRPKVVAS